jgi:hypothetical protein
METYLFVGGRSVDDGQSVDEVRRQAPKPERAFDVAFESYAGPTGPLAPSWTPLGIVVGVAIWGSLGLFPSVWRTLPEALLYVAFAVPFGILLDVWLRTWKVFTARAHAALVGRPDIGDGRRSIALLAVFIGYPVMSVALFVAVVVSLSRISEGLAGW